MTEDRADVGATNPPRTGRADRSDPPVAPGTLRVAVGSGNPVKLAATERALASAREATVEAVPVESGVAEQPMDHEETRHGARQRAERARAGYDLGVGIEGGVAEEYGGLWLVIWAAVTDGERWGWGSGPSLVLPGRIADRVRAGEELGPVMDDVLGEDDVARNQGAAGALGPFVTEHYSR